MLLMVEEILHGGVANAGAVVRAGDRVLRPSNPHTPTIHRFLRHLHDAGFGGAPMPVGVDSDGRERLVFIPGEVPLPPFPVWAQSDDALGSIVRLMRRFHSVGAGFAPDGAATWSDEMADSAAGSHDGRLICHNDVCLENVVFRDGEAVALLDFDFAAPGRPLYDLAQLARMCVPVDEPASAAAYGWEPVEVGRRLRLIAEEYGLPPDRMEFFDILAGSIERGGAFVRRRAEAGDPGFVAMWNDMGGMARFDRRRAWFATCRDDLVRALG
jgi:hypothetical protein